MKVIKIDLDCSDEVCNEKNCHCNFLGDQNTIMGTKEIFVECAIFRETIMRNSDGTYSRCKKCKDAEVKEYNNGRM